MQPWVGFPLLWAVASHGFRAEVSTAQSWGSYPMQSPGAMVR